MYSFYIRWIPELRQHSPDTPVILVGTQADLRTDVKVIFIHVKNPARGSTMTQTGWIRFFFQCSIVRNHIYYYL